MPPIRGLTLASLILLGLSLLHTAAYNQQLELCSVELPQHATATLKPGSGSILYTLTVRGVLEYNLTVAILVNGSIQLPAGYKVEQYSNGTLLVLVYNTSITRIPAGGSHLILLRSGRNTTGELLVTRGPCRHADRSVTGSQTFTGTHGGNTAGSGGGVLQHENPTSGRPASRGIIPVTAGNYKSGHGKTVLNRAVGVLLLVLSIISVVAEYGVARQGRRSS
ncbi:MAG: hypothetical protein LRS48_02710 [Desulfurococcales archaeon]|nr:hypothetical protein [Desulfurococcales archaeon]